MGPSKHCEEHEFQTPWTSWDWSILKCQTRENPLLIRCWNRILMYWSNSPLNHEANEVKEVLPILGLRTPELPLLPYTSMQKTKGQHWNKEIVHCLKTLEIRTALHPTSLQIPPSLGDLWGHGLTISGAVETGVLSSRLNLHPTLSEGICNDLTNEYKWYEMVLYALFV